MAYIHAETVREVLSPDRKAKVDILARDDGLYEFREYVERIEGEPYWSPVERSGLYPTREEVERAALDAIPWLRPQNPN